MNRHDNSHLSTQLLAWYDVHARELPWRVGPHEAGRQMPYLVWLSEIMLQQTTVPHATPYFLKFLKLWPKIEDLAAASADDITREWAGLGYYARARNLHKCAKIVAEAGAFPATYEGLLELPGVGPYTAAAIGSIAYDLPIAPVDGNVERVISRVLAIAGDGTAAGWAADKKAITQKVQVLVPERSGDFAQAMMDLGAGVCTPIAPSCLICPWKDSCQARLEGNQEAYPAKPKRKPQPIRHGVAYIVMDGEQVLLERRPQTGLLGGMLMPLSSPWIEGVVPDLIQHQPAEMEWEYKGDARHVFTHFALNWRVYVGEKGGISGAFDGEWFDKSDVMEAGVPTVGKKALKLALG